MRDAVLAMILGWQGLLVASLTGVAASVYLVWRLRLLGLAVVVAVPAVVIFKLVAWARDRPPNPGALIPPAVEVFLGSWFALLAVPYLLAAIAVGVAVWSTFRSAHRPAAPPPVACAPAPWPPLREPVLDTVLVRPPPEGGSWGGPAS